MSIRSVYLVATRAKHTTKLDDLDPDSLRTIAVFVNRHIG